MRRLYCRNSYGHVRQAGQRFVGGSGIPVRFFVTAHGWNFPQ